MHFFKIIELSLSAYTVKKILANHVFWWWLLLFYTPCCSCWNFQCCGFLLLPLKMMQSHCQNEVSRIQPRLRGLPPFKRLHGKIWSWLRGLPSLVDQATRPGGSPHLSCKCDQIKMRDYRDRRVTPPERVTSPSWGPPPPCKQALNGSMNKDYTLL